MCEIIVVNRGEKELETPREVHEHFNIPLKKYWCYKDVDLDCCLCQLDLDAMFIENNIPFKKERGSWYHVGGDLDSLVFD